MFGLGIDNMVIEIDGGECPGLDGSSLPFCEVLKKAGVQELSEPKNILRIREPIYISENGTHLIALPYDGLKISYTLDYPLTPLKSQFASFVIDPDTYLKEISPARTFCLEEEVEKLQALGLGKGSDYSNTVVIGTNGIINNTLRFDNEPVRHKILDLIGDLALLGCNLKTHIIGIRSGHAINTQFVRKLKDLPKRDRIGAIQPPSDQVAFGDVLETEDIKKIIPHRYPFLLVDRIIELVEGKRAIGIKNVTSNEWFFVGHFPNRPVMPGVLIVEAMAQVAGVLMLSKKENKGKLAYFMSIDKVKFRKAVIPGNQLILQVEVVKSRRKVAQIHSRALVNEKLVAEADLMSALVEP